MGPSTLRVDLAQNKLAKDLQISSDCKASSVLNNDSLTRLGRSASDVYQPWPQRSIYIIYFDGDLIM